MKKTKTIKLVHFSYPNRDTANGEPRQHQWRVDVESLCEASAWTVTITENKEDI